MIPQQLGCTLFHTVLRSSLWIHTVDFRSIRLSTDIVRQQILAVCLQISLIPSNEDMIHGQSNMARHSCNVLKFPSFFFYSVQGIGSPHPWLLRLLRVESLTSRSTVALFSLPTVGHKTESSPSWTGVFIPTFSQTAGWEIDATLCLPVHFVARFVLGWPNLPVLQFIRQGGKKKMVFQGQKDTFFFLLLIILC